MSNPKAVPIKTADGRELRYCSSGDHWTTLDGVYLKKPGVRRFKCESCQAKTRPGTRLSGTVNAG